MKQTAVEWLESQILEGSINIENGEMYIKLPKDALKKAKEMEKKEKLKHQLFIGKVSDVIGFDKTLELLRECNNTIKC